MFFFAVLLFITAAALLVLRRMRIGRHLGWIALGAFGAGGLSLLFSCLFVVGAAEVGVPVTLGKVGEPMRSGTHFASPLTSVATFSTRAVNLDLGGEDSVEVRSSQGGVMTADVTVKWTVAPDKAVDLYRLAGDEDSIEEQLIVPDTREIIRNVFAAHTSEEGYASARVAIAGEIAAQVEARLEPRGLTVTTVNLRNVKPSKELQAQIDRTIQQEQATARAKEAARTAEAEAERRRIEAEGIARANRILNGSLSDRVLASQCIDAFEKAAGKGAVYAVPCGDGSRTPVIVDGSKD
ncbi:SPFH domain-containing protein [Streptomyces polyrhachis]|uniref:SPFH domain-containing protein n=1 Tax=Streptomyces polyrhachis TaxID=1282885 RepID=A0ABW2GQD5_9ACTN